MDAKTDKLNCYIEGIRIPINTFNLTQDRNQLTQARCRIPAGGAIEPIMWANAFLQVTCIQDREEKLLFEGTVSNINVVYEENIIVATVDSKWLALNLNTTHDYMAPKKYGIRNLEDGTTIFLGNELEITTENVLDNAKYHLSSRYFFLNKENQDSIVKLTGDDTESVKLQYVLDKTPFASMIGFVLFELIAYDNFFLTQAYVNRFNLLKKISDASSRLGFELIRKQAEIDANRLTSLDPSRSGFIYQKAEVKQGTQMGMDVAGLSLSSIPSSLPFKPISQKAKEALLNSNYHTPQGYKDNTGFVSVDQIVLAYNTYCQQMNVDANLLLAQAYHESAGFNPYAQSGSGAAGWAQFVGGTWTGETGLPLEQRFSILQSIRAQCKYMHQMFSAANGDANRALSNYVDGSNASSRPQTPAYLASISGIYSRYMS